MIQSILVKGMTCENCVAHVSKALSALPGVRDVEIDLRKGTAKLETDVQIDRPILLHALEEEGYELG